MEVLLPNLKWPQWVISFSYSPNSVSVFAYFLAGKFNINSKKLLLLFCFFREIAAFGQHVDANGQINFAGADMAGSSYLPNEAVFLPASMGTETFTQPDLPPLTEPKTNKPNLNNKAKGKKSKQPLPPVVNNAQSSTVEGVVANNTVQPADPSSDILQFQPVVDPASAGSMQPLETYEAYTAAVASAAVDLDSETDSNHDTALTLACAGGHEELVTLLINRGANIGK